MGEFWTWMGPSAIASAILAPVHCLFGLHIVRRGVIFIDLAVAQVAALGTSFAVAGGNEPNSSTAYWMSLGFGLLAAFLIALTRFKLRLVPHEAIIGIIFVVGSAWSIIALSGASHGLEEMQSMLVGNIFTVSPKDIDQIKWICGGILLALILMWRAFTRVTMEHEEKADLRQILTDFVFYSLLALLVASAVQIAGVLLVFTWLVMPPVCAFLWVRSMGAAVTLALPVALVGSLIGLWMSYGKDWPTGATMVVVFGAIAAVFYVLRLLIRDQSETATSPTPI